MKRWVVGCAGLFIALLVIAGSAQGHRPQVHHFGMGLQFVIPLGPVFQEDPHPTPGCFYECYPRYDFIHRLPIPMTGHDLFLMSIKTQQALENARSGERTQWFNPKTGVGGYVVVHPAYNNSVGQICRSFDRVLARGIRKEHVYGVACREPDGHWNLMLVMP